MRHLQRILYIALFASAACSQDVIDLEEPMPPDEVTCETVSAGSASFTKFVAVGSSYVAGFQAGALFTAGQDNSLAAILNKQFECAGSPASFQQPSINTVNGFNIFITPNPVGNVVLGRMLLQGASPRPTPQVSGTEAIPNPVVNPSFIYAGGKTSLNNFGVQAMLLGQALIPETGNWALAGKDPRFNPFYGRLSYPGNGTATLVTDAAASNASFFLFWLGMDDYLLNAAFGGDNTKAPLTEAAAFDMQYKLAIGAMLLNPQAKGVVCNYPNIFKMPHFTSVPWNAVPLNATTAAGLTESLAVNYNGFLDQLAVNKLISAEEVARRKLAYAAGQNGILINDETLTDLSPYMQGPAAALLPYAQARQTTKADILPLSAGSVIGTAIGGDATKVYGVSVPLPDQYVLIPSESSAIEMARIAFNSTVKSVADAFPERLAFADVNQALENLIAAQLMIVNNVSITANINPPTGIYSEDGIHPNSRGYAYLSNAIISAINTRFGATINPTDISKYQATALPLP